MLTENDPRPVIRLLIRMHVFRDVVDRESGTLQRPGDFCESESRAERIESADKIKDAWIVNIHVHVRYLRNNDVNVL